MYKRTIHSASDWKQIIEAYHSSGLRKASFCRKHDVASTTFYKQLKRAEEGNVALAAKSSTESVGGEISQGYFSAIKLGRHQERQSVAINTE